MAPVARRYSPYPKDSPQRVLHDFVSRAYPKTLTGFFKAVAKKTGVTQESAKGTFYSHLRMDGTARSLPDDHREAYLDLIKGLTPQLLNALETSRRTHREITEHPDLLAELSKTVDDLQETVDALQQRVTNLETGASGQGRESEAA